MELDKTLANHSELLSGYIGWLFKGALSYTTDLTMFLDYAS